MKLFITPLFLTLFTLFSYSQKVKIDSTKFTIKHGDMILYLDEDTNSYVSVHKISVKNIKKLDGITYQYIDEFLESTSPDSAVISSVCCRVSTNRSSV